MEISGSSSVSGIQNVIAQHSARAERLAKAAEMDQVEKDLAELPQDPPKLGMQSKVIKTKDDMLGTLLDMFG
jgi:hypothetical protein